MQLKILDIQEVKEWLRIDDDYDDKSLEMLAYAAESYLNNATGKTFDSTNQLAKLFCLVLVTDWYENRELIGQKASDKVRFTIQSILAQLQYGGDNNEIQGNEGF